MNKNPPELLVCPIHQGLEVFGDKWTFLIVRELLINESATFNDLQNIDENISTGVLSNRIAKMTDAGLILRRPSKRDGRSADYYLSPKGRALEPILVDVITWVADFVMPETDRPIVERTIKTRRLLPPM